MKTILLLLLGLSLPACSDNQNLSKPLHEIVNFQLLSPQLASAGRVTEEQYQDIKDYGFKHVINLVPGNQLKQRKHVQSLGMSYQQIAVDWGNPTAENFTEFARLMKTYGDDKVFVHCEMNMRASAFVYLYRVLYLDVDEKEALKNMSAIWRPQGTWKRFIQDILATRKVNS